MNTGFPALLFVLTLSTVVCVGILGRHHPGAVNYSRYKRVMDLRPKDCSDCRFVIIGPAADVRVPPEKYPVIQYCGLHSRWQRMKEQTGDCSAGIRRDEESI